ncbi:DUF2630 family protein [Kribbella shirazensis]|uniref:DUF2630 family protein n=1 Tax=Kribbella shirazensis TaxID=1105143 RepID=A0A7X5VHI3_9ACTN|nr:DUF2630 family protein [Kribbella shirazensis]NIK61376.1 hypothetical protein [Kribbella shirazensis]
MPTDESVHDVIRRLVGEEHHLRANRAGPIREHTAQLERLRAVEVELDQCWDLLRQRRALRTAGADPDAAAVRPASQVERYLQ